LPADQESDFAERLSAALEDEQIQRSLDPVHSDTVPDPVAAIRSDVLDRRESILGEIKAHRDARDKARERHSDAVAALRRVKRLTRLAGMAAIGSAGALAIWIVTDVPPPAYWVLPEPFFFLWFVSKLLHETKKQRLRFDERTRGRDALEQRYVDALKDEITAAIRSTINARVRSMRTEFELIDKRGLRELADPEREVPTEATTEVRTMMTALAGGSLGLSGPRGCGKTTLIYRFATGRSVLPDGERRGLVVSAPVRYDAREFVLHLYARVCEHVLNPQGAAIQVPRREQLRAARRTALAKLQFAFAVACGVAGAVMLLTHRTTPVGYEETGWFLVASAVVVGYAGIFVIPSPFRPGNFWERLGAHFSEMFQEGTPGTEPDTPPRFKPDQLAEQRLEEIRFQQTLASGWSASFGLPLGSKLGGESKLTLARTPWTLPEVVDEFKAYLGTLTDSHYLVIGIDELDKIDSSEDAQRFLNDIKGVFGVRGVYYLVSVSEDAMSNFERRGMPFRDVFDSSFDAILRVRHLSLAESREVLESRVTGLPVPYQCLCHVLSGGLPRDLVRVARELVHQNESGGDTTMGGLCRAVIASELRGKAAAAEVVARATDGGERDLVLGWLQRYDIDQPDPAALRTHFDELAMWSGLTPTEADDDAACRLRALALELMAFSYYAATVLEFFGDEPSLRAFLTKDPPLSTDLSPVVVDALERLTRARKQFAMSPGLAASSVTSFRGDAELPPWTLCDGLSVTSASDERVLADQLSG